MIQFPETQKECDDSLCSECGANVYTQYCRWPGKRKYQERAQ